ncbi:MAG: leucyl aminopeptidase [Flavobacteriales bacterium]|nr:leucyl aminopeptidase [Flavobacteriales bacterium]
MRTTLNTTTSFSASDSLIILVSSLSQIDKYQLSKAEKDYVKEQVKDTKGSFVTINQYNRLLFICLIKDKDSTNALQEKYRIQGNGILTTINSNKTKSVIIVEEIDIKGISSALVEGLYLGNYQFLNHKTKEKQLNSLSQIKVMSKHLSKKDVIALQNQLDSVAVARDLVNEPLSYLDAPTMVKELQKLSKKSGFKFHALNKKQIETLKMGGILAVNKGSVDPPAFCILEWKPKNASNKKPYVLVGKGVVFDTGGLSLKPTANSMDQMKCDMAGAATVAGTIHAIALSKLPIHIIGLLPLTDNRPGGNAIVPSDVITMHNKMTVEVKNTDAEGRLILADALSYAQKYKPELVIDLATLTGSAYAAIGSLGSVFMGTASEKVKANLKEVGDETYERLVEFPFWDEYSDQIKSDVADLSNLGGPTGGAITAGKFLENFIDYPWLHIDIAGTAFLTATDNYKAKGGTGYGVRLLYNFFDKLSK